ncbi:hypothetical protein EJ419_03085 [Alloscardovia theropitheci]|uniref:DUF6630 domain-containing protein n=1 Tax=Alloscardovia theropitheci TaxID=2496842 RepID=A0A4R0QQA9_9BIFI|nr:DUF6630 family protein [Alloscardovia theropitheci]TCD54474.1 hypothetical protein EJ419_03085 [Alloscardovia theropitheci]
MAVWNRLWRKEYSQWSMAVGDKIVQDFTWHELNLAIKAIAQGKAKSVIIKCAQLLPASDGCLCDFIHIFPDSSANQDGEQFHYGINTISAPGALDKVTYDVAHASRAQLDSFLKQVLDTNQLPDIRSWNIIIDKRNGRDGVDSHRGNPTVTTMRTQQSQKNGTRQSEISRDDERFDRKIHKEIIERLTENEHIWETTNYSYDQLRELFLKTQKDNPHWDIEDDGTFTTYWGFSIAHLLIKENDICTMSWEDDIDKFIRALQPVADKKDLDIERSWFNAEEEVPIWCTVLQHKWDDAGYDIGVIDMDTDSYIFFVAKKVVIEELRQLTMKTAYTIDFAEF